MERMGKCTDVPMYQFTNVPIHWEKREKCKCVQGVRRGRYELISDYQSLYFCLGSSGCWNISLVHRYIRTLVHINSPLKLRNQHIPKLAYFLALVFCIACAPVRNVRPLDKGEWRVSGSLGGPLIHFAGAVIPVPYTSLAAGYGIRKDLSASVGLHTTALAFGVIQTDLSATYAPLRPSKWKPGISLTPVVNLAGDVWQKNFRLWPQLDANAFWEYGQRKHYFYTGFSNWFELNNNRPHEEDQPSHWLVSINAGNYLSLGNWNFSQEFRWMAPGKNNQKVVVDYVKPGNTGAIGIYFGVGRKIKWKR